MKILKHILRVFKEYPLLTIMVFYSAVVPQMIVILLLLLFMVTAFNMLDEYYDKYFSLYCKIQKLIDVYFDDNYDKWLSLRNDMSRNYLKYTINPRKIKKSIDYLYNNYNFLPEIKQEVREAKLKQLV